MGASIFQHIGGAGGAQTPASPQPGQGQQPGMSGMRFSNPAQKAAFIMQAMTNPAAFAKQAFPDIPNEIANNPQAILNYLQQTRGITQEQIQQLQAQNPYGGGR